MNLIESLRALLALGREVVCSGELDATPPGGRHLTEFLDAHESFCRLARSEIRAVPGGSRFLGGVIVDLSNHLCCLHACEEIALLVAHAKAGTSNAITESRECLRTTFDAAFAFLEDIEAPLAAWTSRNGLSPV